MNRRLNGFIKKPHIFVDKYGQWVFNCSVEVKSTDRALATMFCSLQNQKKEYRNG